jgi:choline dehydrogenase-like flavoprotein
MKRRTFITLAGLAAGGAAVTYYVGNDKSSDQDFLPTGPFDYIIVGSGTAGATLARELARNGQKVLLLERGEYVPLKETLLTMASMLNEVQVTDELKDGSAFAAGGSSAMYMAIAETPPFEAFRALGIDLSPEFEAVRREVPLTVMPDALMTPQAHTLTNAAVALGHDWKKNLMFIDPSKADGGYAYEAKWKALSFVDESIRLGATLRCETLVQRVLIENNQAIGVECQVDSSPFSTQQVRFYARNVVVSAGSLATPIILQNSGLKNVTAKGYYIDPSSAVFGRVPGLQGSEGFAGALGATLSDGTKLLDANAHQFAFNALMLGSLRPLSIASYEEHIGIMIKAHDALGGSLSNDGRYHKKLEPAVFEKLKNGEDVARNILSHAGATDIFTAPMMTGGAFGTLRIGDEVNEKLQTQVGNLYVCDGSLMPDNGRAAPALTLICLAKYLAKVLLT